MKKSTASRKRWGKVKLRPVAHGARKGIGMTKSCAAFGFDTKVEISTVILLLTPLDDEGKH